MDNFSFENLNFSENEENNSSENIKNQADNNDNKDSNKGMLDDTNLSEDFVIGQDFFIDDTEEFLYVEEQGKKKKSRKNKGVGKGCLGAVVWMAAILIIAVIAAVGACYLGMDYFGVSFDSDSAENNIEIVVEKGDTAKKIADMLEEKGVIESPLFFRFYASQSGNAANFRNGVYYFSKQDSYEDIAEKLIKQGQQADSVKVTIPEGWTVDQIAERLQENKVCTAAQFKEAVNEADSVKYNYDFMSEIRTELQGVHYRLEGYLFPDTYYFYATNNKSGAEQAIKKMLDNFDKKITSDMREKAKSMGYSMHDILTLSSIIELESSVAKYSDKQLVSSVFWNRLNNWGDSAFLQSDPTKNYKYNKDTYDTYLSPGLAPGAYCSPSLDSIKAALCPESSEYYFFVTDKNMKFYFNKTNAEHDRTIKKLKNEGLWA